MNGTALESAVIDEISQQNKKNPRVQLRNLEISAITKNMLQKFTNIYSIDLRLNDIAEIEDASFSENSKLEKIDLMENCLTKVSKKMLIGTFEELQEINLSYNLIASIESGSFERLTQLESIDLSCNCLQHLHSDLFKKSPELRQVYLHDNEITKIESDLFNSKTDLKLLDLSRNKLDFIPEFEMKKIKHFDLSSNNITLLDLSFDSHERKKSASIVELILQFNRISVCTELDDRRTDIVHLDITGNLLEHLDDFPSFLNLEVLILANNSITDLILHNLEERFPSLKLFNIRENPVDCNDFRYVRNNLQSVVVAADASLIHRCHSNHSSLNIDEYEDYEDAIISEIRAKNREVIKQLKINRSILLMLLSVLVVALILATAFLLQNRIGMKKRTKENLLNQMEM